MLVVVAISRYRRFGAIRHGPDDDARNAFKFTMLNVVGRMIPKNSQRLSDIVPARLISRAHDICYAEY